MRPAPDPYATLGVSAGASDAELRLAYRRAVQRHHPDHNGGSAESTQRFEEVQEAYARIRRLRARAAQPAGSGADPELEARLAEMERELAADRADRERAAKRAREREQAARNAREREQAAARARQAAAHGPLGEPGRRPTDEELGYFKTHDSFSKIFSDAVSELSDRLSAQEPHVPKRVADLIDELEAKLRDSPER